MNNERMVMIPGPTPVVKPITEQMGRDTIAFGDPRFVRDYKWLIDNLAQTFNCSGKVFPLAGTGTCGMEMAVANTTKRGDNVLVVSNGFFGDKFVEICTRKGLNVDVIKAEWGKVVPVEEIEAKLAEKNYAAMTVTHVDTATGAVAPVAEIGKMVQAKFPETVYIVDGVAATAGEYADVDGFGIDVMFTGSQKAFGVCPGMFIVWAGKKALERRKSMEYIPEYFLDFEKWIPIMDNPAKYFATPPVNLVWALAESLRIIQKEGLKERAERHAKNAKAMQAAFEALGFTILADKANRAVTLSNLIYPEGINDAEFRNTLCEEGIIVAGGLGAYTGKMFRIGHMGNIDINDEVAVLGVIERALRRCGRDIEFGTGVKVYLEEMTK